MTTSKTMDIKKINIGSTELYITIKDGEISKGQMYASTVMLYTESNENTIEFSDKVNWDDEEGVKQAIIDALELEERWPETADPEWDNHTLAKPDTQVWKVISFVMAKPYCTSNDVDNALDLDGQVQNVIYTCKNKNLIKTVGRDGNAHILAPTHLAYKEMFIDLGPEEAREH